MSKVKVTKSYSRKVNLRGISSRYDCIELGSYLSAEIECVDEDDLNKKSEALALKVRKETEKDIFSAMKNLISLSKDSKNSVLLGIGNDVESSGAASSQIEGFDDLIKESENMSIPDGIKEVEM